MDNSRNVTIAAIVAAAMIICAFVFRDAYISRTEKTGNIEVTGLGEREFTSDLIVWSGYFKRMAPALKDAYADLDKDREVVRKYLISNGVPEKEIVFSSVNISKEFETIYHENGGSSDRFIGYSLSQNVTISSSAVEKVEDISRRVTEVINQGVEFNSYEPAYYYTKLAELKLQMIAEATADARKRAEEIAKNAGADLGDLITADMGVFQITGKNSNEDYSWGGAFNTSSKEKSASITMRLTFEVD